MFSKRTNWNFSENKLTQLLNTLKREGVSVLDLSESNPTRCNFEYLKNNGLLSRLNHPSNMFYQPVPAGKQEAREAISAYYRKKGIEVDPKRIFLTASTSEAYNFILRLLTNPGDRLLAPKPSYPLFQFIADLNDVELDQYRLHLQNGIWQTDVTNLAALIEARTKAIIVVHPNNPTGSFIKIDESRRLIEFARLRLLALVSDEVFSDYGFEKDVKRKQSFADTREVLTFTLGGISKSLGLPQMKISWIVLSGPDTLVQEASQRLEVILDTYLSVNTPSQEALAHWFSHQDEIQTEIKERTSGNYDFLEKRIQSDSGISHLKSEGGWYAALKLPNVKNEEEWAVEFLEQDHVFVHPGYFFDFEEGTHVVISLLPEPAQFQEACERMFKRVETVKTSFQSAGSNS